jgi:hypothetical protein
VALRESINQKLDAFAAEVERERTRLASFTEIFTQLCQGMSEGVTALKPAIEIGERLIGAFARLAGQAPIATLPPSDDLDLIPSDRAAGDAGGLSNT